MLVNYTCTSTAPSAQLLPYAAMCAGVTAFSTGGDLPRVTGTDTAHGNCQWRLLQRKSSSFLRVLCYCMCTRDATPLLYGRTRMHLLVERHIPWPHAAMRMFPHGSGSQELERGQWLWQTGTCLCLVNNCQGLHTCDTTAFIFQGIVSKKYDWCLFLFPSIVQFSVSYC